MQTVLNNDTLKAVCDEIENVCKQCAVSFEKATKAFTELAKASQEYHNAWFTGYKDKHPRVVHLAYNAKKARVRKKNRNRIRRMK